MTSQVIVYAIRTSCSTYTKEELIKFCRYYGKEWEFQREVGESTGYEHFQGYISLQKKHRESEIKAKIQSEGYKIPEYMKPASDIQATKLYCKKNLTRVEGPWNHTTEEIYIPRQYRGKLEKLYPFQKHIFDTANEFNDRDINMIYCPHGNIGKSTIAALCELFAKGIDLPPVNDADKLIQSCCDIAKALNVRDPTPIFIDLPRAMNKDRLNGIYTAIEQIKKGKLYDLRYTYKVHWIDSPQIWVFSNIEPDLDLLSLDRWKIWEVNTDYELVKYEPKIKITDDPLEYGVNPS